MLKTLSLRRDIFVSFESYSTYFGHLNIMHGENIAGYAVKHSRSSKPCARLSNFMQ